MFQSIEYALESFKNKYTYDARAGPRAKKCNEDEDEEYTH